MRSGDTSDSDPDSGGSVELCTRFWALDRVRVDLDRRLTELPDNDQRRDVLWQELESLLTQISDLVARLATVKSAEPKGLGARASVLARLLRAGEVNPPALDPGTISLAISVADVVATLAGDGAGDGASGAEPEATSSATRSSMISRLTA